MKLLVPMTALLLSACAQEKNQSATVPAPTLRTCASAGHEWHTFPSGRAAIAHRWHCHDGRTCVVAWVSADGLENATDGHPEACLTWGAR